MKYKDPEFGRKMLEGFYVDDLVTGKNNLNNSWRLKAVKVGDQ